MSDATSVTMDGSGRFVLPKEIRAELGLRAGQRLNVAVHDGSLELTPQPLEAELHATDGGVLVIMPTEPVDALTPQDVADAINRARR